MNPVRSSALFMLKAGEKGEADLRLSGSNFDKLFLNF